MSQAIPALILAKRPEFGKADVKLQTARTLEEAMRVLRTRQNAEGGFGLWNASVQADEFASVYAVHMMLEARERGEAVPADMLQKGLDYAQKLASSPGTSMWELRTRAYAAYLLTRQMAVTTPILTSIRETLESQGRDLAYTTVATLVRILLDKQFLTQTCDERPFKFKPARSYEEVSRTMLGDLVQKVFGGST